MAQAAASGAVSDEEVSDEESDECTEAWGPGGTQPPPIKFKRGLGEFGLRQIVI